MKKREHIKKENVDEYLEEVKKLTNVGLIAHIIKRQRGEPVVHQGWNPKAAQRVRLPKARLGKHINPRFRPYKYMLTVEFVFKAKVDIREGLHYKKEEDGIDLKYMFRFLNRQLRNKILLLQDIHATKCDPIEPEKPTHINHGMEYLPLRNTLDL